MPDIVRRVGLEAHQTRMVEGGGLMAFALVVVAWLMQIAHRIPLPR